MSDAMIQISNTIFETLTIVVNKLNSFFTSTFPTIEYVPVMIIALFAGFYLKKKLSTNYWYFTLFSLLIYMSLRYLGLGVVT